jgi:hypothetical protein
VVEALPLHFQQISRTLLYETGLSETELTLGAEDALQGTQKDVGCQCIDLSHKIW